MRNGIETNKVITQAYVVSVMSKKPVGIYSVSKVHNILKALGNNISVSAVRNHLGKMELLGFVNKVKASGLVAFEFLASTTESFNAHEKIRLEELAATRGRMKRRESTECKEGFMIWGKSIDGVRVAMKGVGTVKMIGV